MAPTGHSGADTLVHEDDVDAELRDVSLSSLPPSMADLYAAMLAPYVGVSFYFSDEEERRREPASEDKDEEYYYRVFPPSSPEPILGSDVRDYDSTAEEEMAPPPQGNAKGGAAAGTGGSLAAVFRRQVEDEGAGELIADASYEADSECECGRARCATRKEARAAAARKDDWWVVARLTAVAEHGCLHIGYALRTAAAWFTAGCAPPGLHAAQQLLKI